MYKIYKITSHATVDFAAEELKKYLRMMMPEAGEIVIEYSPGAKDGFRLGLMSDLSLDTSEADDVALDDIIHIDANEKGGIIAGSNVRSVLLAVYKYLTLNGCRWLFPGVDGEYIPVKDITPITYHKMADNRIRGWCNEGAEFQRCMLDAIDYAPKIGLNLFMLEFFNPLIYYSWYYNHPHNQGNREPEPISATTSLQWKRQCEAEITKRSLAFADIGHGWTTRAFDINDEDVFAGGEAKIPEENRQYLAMLRGKRELYIGRPNHTNLCFSNSEGRKKVVDYVIGYAKKAKHVDYLCFSLADSFNNHCECEECIKKTPSDWFVIMLNEIDDELTRLGLDTKIRFNNYLHTIWPPETEKINNPKRFLESLAAISREYFRPIPEELDDIELTKHVHNKISLPKSVGEYMRYAFEWKKLFGTTLAAYEYHFYVHQYMSPNVIRFARIIHDDVKGYKKHGFSGIVEDGTQRPFFPNGFSLYVYARTLFDANSDFDALTADYFGAAYGEDWKEIKEYFERLDTIFNHRYLTGRAEAKIASAPYYSPEEAARMRGIYELNAAFAPFLEAHKNMPMRAQTVAMRLLRKYTELWEMMAKPLIFKAYGADNEAKAAYLDVLDTFGKYEVEIERYYDQHMLGMAFDKRFTQTTDIMNIGAR